MFKLFLSCAVFTSLLATIPTYEKCFLQGEAKLRDSELFKAAYEKSHFDRVVPSENPRIPKIIHHIWVGGPLPSVFQKYIDSWKKHHPDWEHRLWTDDDVKDFEFVTGQAYFRCQNPGHKADILRYEILNKIGGLYVDTDFLCIKPHDKLHHACDFYTGMGANQIYIGIIGSAPCHPIIKKCLDRIKNKNGFYNSGQKIASNTGPFLFTNSVREFLEAGNEGAIVYPPRYYYLFPAMLRYRFWNNHENLRLVRPYITPDTLAVHLWAVSWHKSAPSRRKIKHSRRTQAVLAGAS